MKPFCVTGALIASAVLATPAQAQESVTQYVVCMTHYGDADRPSDITPVVRMTWPSPRATVLQINDSYFHIMQQRGPRFYKAQCWASSTAERAANAVDQWEEISGYGKGPRREQAADEIFPAMFDYSYSILSRMDDNITRASFSAIVVDSAVDAAANAEIKKVRKEAEELETRRKPPQQLEITAGPSAPKKMSNAEADAKYAAEMADYQKALDARAQAEAQRQQAIDAAEQQKARNAAAAGAAQAEYERQRAEYRERYKQATGSYPND